MFQKGRATPQLKTTAHQAFVTANRGGRRKHVRRSKR